MQNLGGRHTSQYFLSVFFKDIAISFIRAKLPKGFKCIYRASNDAMHSDRICICNKEGIELAVIFADGSKEEPLRINIVEHVLDKCDLAERGTILELLSHIRMTMAVSYTFV